MMIIAVLNEVSSCAKNTDLFAALDGRGHEVINLGMTSKEQCEMTYCDTSFMTALLLNMKMADLVVSGCGTGQGYAIAANQYPGVICANVRDPLDAWLFRQINDGNAISLALNKGYGWAGGQDLRLLFDAYFNAPDEGGYPPERAEAQARLRKRLNGISRMTHCSMEDIIAETSPDIICACLNNAVFMERLEKVDDRNTVKKAFLAAANAVKDRNE